MTRTKPIAQIISRKYKIHGYPFKIRLVWGNTICFAVLHRNEHLLKLIMSSYLKDFDHKTKHNYVNQAKGTYFSNSGVGDIFFSNVRHRYRCRNNKYARKALHNRNYFSTRQLG